MENWENSSKKATKKVGVAGVLAEGEERVQSVGVEEK